MIDGGTDNSLKQQFVKKAGQLNVMKIEENIEQIYGFSHLEKHFCSNMYHFRLRAWRYSMTQ